MKDVDFTGKLAKRNLLLYLRYVNRGPLLFRFNLHMCVVTLYSG